MLAGVAFTSETFGTGEAPTAYSLPMIATFFANLRGLVVEVVVTCPRRSRRNVEYTKDIENEACRHFFRTIVIPSVAGGMQAW